MTYGVKIMEIELKQKLLDLGSSRLSEKTTNEIVVSLGIALGDLCAYSLDCALTKRVVGNNDIYFKNVLIQLIDFCFSKDSTLLEEILTVYYPVDAGVPLGIAYEALRLAQGTPTLLQILAPNSTISAETKMEISKLFAVCIRNVGGTLSSWSCYAEFK